MVWIDGERKRTEGILTSIVRRTHAHENRWHQKHNHSHPTRIIPIIASIDRKEEIAHPLDNIVPHHEEHRNTHTKRSLQNHLPQSRPPIHSRDPRRIQSPRQTSRKGQGAGRDGANGGSHDDSNLDVAVVFSRGPGIPVSGWPDEGVEEV